jgi:hypothetical protein
MESTAVWSSVKLEAWGVGITAGSRELPGRKGLWQETSISYNNNKSCWLLNPRIGEYFPAKAEKWEIRLLLLLLLLLLLFQESSYLIY